MSNGLHKAQFNFWFHSALKSVKLAISNAFLIKAGRQKQETINLIAVVTVTLNGCGIKSGSGLSQTSTDAGFYNPASLAGMYCNMVQVQCNRRGVVRHGPMVLIQILFSQGDSRLFVAMKQAVVVQVGSQKL